MDCCRPITHFFVYLTRAMRAPAIIARLQPPELALAPRLSLRLAGRAQLQLRLLLYSLFLFRCGKHHRQMADCPLLRGSLGVVDSPLNPRPWACHLQCVTALLSLDPSAHGCCPPALLVYRSRPLAARLRHQLQLQGRATPLVRLLPMHVLSTSSRRLLRFLQAALHPRFPLLLC